MIDREPPDRIHEKDEHGDWICCCGDHLPCREEPRLAGYLIEFRQINGTWALSTPDFVRHFPEWVEKARDYRATAVYFSAKEDPADE